MQIGPPLAVPFDVGLGWGRETFDHGYDSAQTCTPYPTSRGRVGGYKWSEYETPDDIKHSGIHRVSLSYSLCTPEQL